MPRKSESIEPLREFLRSASCIGSSICEKTIAGRMWTFCTNSSPPKSFFISGDICPPSVPFCAAMKSRMSLRPSGFAFSSPAARRSWSFSACLYFLPSGVSYSLTCPNARVCSATCVARSM